MIQIPSFQNYKFHSAYNSPKFCQSRQITQKQNNYFKNTQIIQTSTLSSQQVKILLGINQQKSLNDTQTISNIVKKQIILEKRKMFDPVKYFGGPNISSLQDEFPDQRLQRMFQKSSEKNIGGLSKQRASYKNVQIGISQTLKKSFQSSHSKLEINKPFVNIICKNIKNESKKIIQKSAPQSPLKTLPKQNKKQILKNSHRNSNLLSKNININDSKTTFQKLKLRLKINRIN